MNKQKHVQSERTRYGLTRGLIKALLLISLAFGINSCKKELYSGEGIDPKRKKEILGFKNGPKIEVINLAQFKNKANLNALGSLKEEFVSASSSKSNLMSIQTAETYLGFNIITDSIKVIKDKGHTMYVFPVALSSKKAVTFQNLTIDEGPDGTVVFVNTYTPTKKWIAAWKKGHPGKFEGDIIVNYLKLNNGNTPISKKSTQNSIAVAQICTTTTYYFEIAYFCASGQHYPEDAGCTLIGNEAAGYALFEAIITECVDDPNASGGGGGTSPTPPPTYNPCPGAPPLVSGKKSLGNKIMIAPPTECDSVKRDPLDTDEFRAMEADYRSRMSTAEKVIYDKMTLQNKTDYLSNAQIASTAAVLMFPGMNEVTTKLDAFRHSYWNLLNVFRLGQTLAEQLATAHEVSVNGVYDMQSTMDLHNNAAGRNAFVNPAWWQAPNIFFSDIANNLVTSGALKYMKNGVLTPTNQ